MNYITILSVVTPLSIYHGCSTWKTFWEGKFVQVNMKISGCCNVRKGRDINNGNQYAVLDIFLKFGAMDKMKSISSEPNIIWGGW